MYDNSKFLKVIKECKNKGFIEENEGKLTITKYGNKYLELFVYRFDITLYSKLIDIYKDPVFLLLKYYTDTQYVNRQIRNLT